jgi:hypothetical protein
MKRRIGAVDRPDTGVAKDALIAAVAGGALLVAVLLAPMLF